MVKWMGTANTDQKNDLDEISWQAGRATSRAQNLLSAGIVQDVGVFRLEVFPRTCVASLEAKVGKHSQFTKNRDLFGGKIGICGAVVCIILHH